MEPVAQFHATGRFLRRHARGPWYLHPTGPVGNW